MSVELCGFDLSKMDFFFFNYAKIIKFVDGSFFKKKNLEFNLENPIGIGKLNLDPI